MIFYLNLNVNNGVLDILVKFFEIFDNDLFMINIKFWDYVLLWYNKIKWMGYIKILKIKNK